MRHRKGHRRPHRHRRHRRHRNRPGFQSGASVEGSFVETQQLPYRSQQIVSVLGARSQMLLKK